MDENLNNITISDDSLLAFIDPKEMKVIMKNGRKQVLKKGENLFIHGDKGETMVVVLKGTLKVFINTASGKEIVLDYLGTGQVIGEMALFSQKPRSANVSTVEETEIISLSRNQVIPYLENNGKSAISVILGLIQRIRRTNKLLEQHTMPMGQKLAHGLLRLFEEHGSGDKLNFSISQTELGNHVNLTRENVNRQLKDWEKDGFVSLKKGSITILDKEALSEIAEFCW